ncbi:DUF3887 domain-containing protein [Bernardetia sp. ABR2-2B]|uniref:DUF3887 domain-containing protein n=1 Tax=Bernardetia sp. ABR2-2B TaxID=3127472 RepID=UPI0030D2CFBA
MKTILFIAMMIFPFFTFGQSESVASKEVAAKFEQYYNQDEYQKIFDLFDATMKEALPLEKTTGFMKQLKAQVGSIENREFIKYVNSSYASYKTKFTGAILDLRVSLNSQNQINGLLVKPYIENNIPILERNQTKLILPFKEEWTVFWGGDTKELNYHVDNEAQKYAFDIIIKDEKGSSHKTDGSTNEDYYAFGKELIAPCDAEVVLVVDGIKDNIPGEMNPIYVPGNTVVLKTANNEYLFFAHFKQHSIVVKQGQKIKQGELLGLCGNSGNSSEPHLHFHIQNDEDINKSTGAKCYFDNLIVNEKEINDYSPIKGDKIKSSL